MEAIVITKENFEEQVLRAEKPVLVDFWQPELAERFGVETIPTLLVFRNGQAGEPLIAPGSKAQIVEWAGL